MANSKGAFIAYAVVTGLLVLSQTAAGIFDLMGAEPVVKGMNGLGMPLYVLNILGPLKIAGAVVLAIPGALRLKEWAYAGFTFDFGGAFVCHLLAGQAIGEAAPALVFLILLMVSYFLRPASRKLAAS